MDAFRKVFLLAFVGGCLFGAGFTIMLLNYLLFGFAPWDGVPNLPNMWNPR